MRFPYSLVLPRCVKAEIQCLIADRAFNLRTAREPQMAAIADN